MKGFFSLVIASFVLLFLPSCGKKGPLEPPLVRIPQKVEIFNILQRGDKIMLEWTNPSAYLDGSPLQGIREIEIWLVEEEKSESEEAKGVTLEEFEKKARLLASLKKDQFPEYQKRKDKIPLEFLFPYKLTGEDIGTKNLTFALRIKDERKRKSEFSNLLSIKPQTFPLPPSHIQARLFEDRIEISWKSPEESREFSTPQLSGYNLYRFEGEELPRLLNSALIKGEKYEDKDFLFGRTYRYFLRAVASETLPFLESGDSEIVEVVTKDIFAPSPPLGLTAIAGPSFITLSWAENKEKDLAGYRVWRKEEGQDEFSFLTEQPFSENTYTDRTVEKKRRYYYAITAQDRFGNESEKSEIVSEIIKDEFP